MKTTKLFLALVLFFALFSGCRQQITLPEAWRFNTGDDLQYAQKDYDDSAWATIVPGTLWEQQGYPSYDGFAWYRTSLMIPASLKKEAEEYGGLVISLGMIDDSDETFFNGELIGATGKMPPHHETAWNTLRSYSIPADKIVWGERNTIAVRVYDSGGGGGIYSAPIEIAPRGVPDFFTLATPFREPDRIFKGSPDVIVPLTLKNEFTKNFKGELTVKVTSDFGEEIFSTTKKVTVKKMTTADLSFNISGLNPGFYKVTASVSGVMLTKQIVFNFGYDPESIISPVDCQPDFEAFWAEAKRELAAVAPHYRMIKVDSLCTEKHNVYLVEMHSLGDVLIRGWYQVPTAPGRYPAVMQVPGYSTTMMPGYVNYGDDIIGFGLNIRGHGNSCDDVNPGFPGYILTNLDDKEKYIYRGAYMDCVRAVDFLFSRPEVDTKRVAVEGASQGGALTFATAALNNDRIRVCAPQVPFLSDFRHYFKVATWPGSEFVNYVETEKRESWDEVFNTLSYFDIKNLAPMIKAPLLMGAGLKDDVCPPHINFAAYNNVTSEKKYIVYPEAGHGLPQDFYAEKMKWIRSHFETGN